MKKPRPEMRGRGTGERKCPKSHAPKCEAGRRSGKAMKKPRPEMRGGARKQEKAIKATPQSAGRGVAQKVCKMCKVLTG